MSRSIELDTSIDASSDLEQRRILLETIQKALDQEQDTHMTLASKDNGENIDLQVTIRLHTSLRPMEWVFKLRKCPDVTVTERFVLPLLADRARANAEKVSLLQHLKEKDSVIGKLISQMQADGSDMSKIFPGTIASRSSGKTNIRSVVGKSVKGFAEFDELAWQNQVSHATLGLTDMNGLLSELSPLSLPEVPQPVTLAEQDGWWSSMSQLKMDQHDGLFKTESIRPAKETRDPGQGDATEFQVRSLTDQIYDFIAYI